MSKALYTVDDLVDLVAFAKSRGVRIVPEWDMPGHSSISLAMPEVSAWMGNSSISRLPQLQFRLLALLSTEYNLLT